MIESIVPDWVDFLKLKKKIQGKYLFVRRIYGEDNVRWDVNVKRNIVGH